jgi:hypothetical protein
VWHFEGRPVIFVAAVCNGKAKCGGTESERRNASGRGQCLMTTMDIFVPCNLQLATCNFNNKKMG